MQKETIFSNFTTPSIFISAFTLTGFFLSGFLEQIFLLQLMAVLTVFTLFFLQAPLLVWAGFIFLLSFHYGELSFQPEKYTFWPERLKHFWLLFVVGGWFAVWTLLRPYLLSLPLMTILRKSGLTPLSTREQQILQSGQTWIEKEFFSGKPNFNTLFSQPFPGTTKEENVFLKREIPKLCETTSEWDIMKNKDFSQKTLEFIKTRKFLGMIIPKKYGGLGFSPRGHALALQQIASVNIPVAVFTMVPNSLGPSRLIHRFGTQKQKDMWLPLLAEGKEIPCFGLTETSAGSDAGALTSKGVLFKADDGKLKIKINWDKRYVSLGAIATLLGVVFQLKDPDNLLDQTSEEKTVCVLIPVHSSGVKRGLYHDPMGLPFYNAPIRGHNVIVPVEAALIGGVESVGRGWEMLMECLNLGRGISLPSVCVGISQRTVRVVSCYSKIREQFGSPIGKFEGVEEKLARMAGLTGLITATQNFTLSALNQGISAPLPAAITKYNVTERARDIVRDGMDLMGGAGLIRGPKNLMATAYTSLPLAITVEGANILTRSFIIFGQGFLRNHPLVLREISAMEKKDLSTFDRAISKHLYLTICDIIRGGILTLGRGWLYMAPKYMGRGHRALQKLAWSAALFSGLANLAFFGFGVKLKRKEALSGRFADILSHQYMATALLWNWKANGQKKNTWPVVQWGLDYCFQQIQNTMEELLLNLKSPLFLNRLLYFLLRINPLGKAPSDKLSKKTAKSLLTDRSFRQELTDSSLTPTDPKHPLSVLEQAVQLTDKAMPAREKIKQAIRKKHLPRKPIPLLINQALEKQIITREEFKTLKDAEQAREKALQVDAFTREEYLS